MELKDKPKKESTFEWAQRQFREKYGEAVRTQYRVEEHTDSYDQDDNYYPARAMLHDTSEWFDTKEEAEELMAKSKPSSNMWGAYLKIGKRTLYKKWIEPVNGHWQETWV